MTTDTQRAWLAGFFDGEGSIHLVVAKKTGIISARATLCNTDRRTADEMKILLSSILSREIRFEMRNRGYKPMYWFYVKNQTELKTLLETLMPYLVTKKSQARLMLEYLKVAPGKGRTFQSFHYEIVARMRNMNKRYSFGEWDATQRETERLTPRADEETARPAQQCAELNRNDSACAVAQ